MQTNKVHTPIVMNLLDGDIYWGMWRASQNWRMRKPLSYHWFHYFWVPSFCVQAKGAVLIKKKKLSVFPNMSQLWNWEAKSLNAPPCSMLVDRNEQNGGEKMQHSREHISLYCSANVTKQVTHTTWGNIIHETNSVAFDTKKCGS